MSCLVSPLSSSLAFLCTGTMPACGNTCGRGAGAHGDVLNVHTGGVLTVHTERGGGCVGGGEGGEGVSA